MPYSYTDDNVFATKSRSCTITVPLRQRNCSELHYQIDFSNRDGKRKREIREHCSQQAVSIVFAFC
jgi:hypothetical protein